MLNEFGDCANDGVPSLPALNANAKQVLRLLSDEFQPAPRQITRQQTAHVAMKFPDLIEREIQSGCANGAVYYRLTPLGLELRAYIKEQERDQS